MEGRKRGLGREKEGAWGERRRVCVCACENESENERKGEIIRVV